MRLFKTPCLVCLGLIGAGFPLAASTSIIILDKAKDPARLSPEARGWVLGAQGVTASRILTGGCFCGGGGAAAAFRVAFTWGRVSPVCFHWGGGVNRRLLSALAFTGLGIFPAGGGEGPGAQPENSCAGERPVYFSPLATHVLY